jgi:hypothetical protein
VIVLDNGHSKPENEPAAQNDADSDGVPDLEDPDDDNDGILDVDEPDCDLDGIIDDFDDDNTRCLSMAQMPFDDKILEVLPRNGAGIDSPRDSISVDIAVQVRFSCEVDMESIGSDTFLVTAPDAPDSLLQCDLTVSDSNTSVTCLPEGLVPDTAYKARVQSVRCTDGSSTAPTEWTWRTASVLGAAPAGSQVPTIDSEKIPTTPIH